MLAGRDLAGPLGMDIEDWPAETAAELARAIGRHCRTDICQCGLCNGDSKPWLEEAIRRKLLEAQDLALDAVIGQMKRFTVRSLIGFAKDFEAGEYGIVTLDPVKLVREMKGDPHEAEADRERDSA